MSLFSHHKLDWNVARLDRHLEAHADDHAARAELAAALLSRAAFHGGGESDFALALQHARRAVQYVPSDAAVQVVAAACLVGLDRHDAAAKQLEEAEALDPERADLYYVRALWHQAVRRHPPAEAAAEGDGAPGAGGPVRGATAADHERRAVRCAEIACRLAPDAWEPHALLATMLWERVGDRGAGEGAGAGVPSGPRLVERSQFHTVRALDLSPPAAQAAPLVFHLAMTCLQANKLEAAGKLFARLLDDEGYRVRAQYWLGVVNDRAGRHKNAILYLRQHLDHAPDSARVHSRIGMAHLKLGEVVKAREACNRALAIDPNDLGARWTLACALGSEGRDDEAMRMFRAILEDAPDHGPAFAELVRLRRQRSDVAWLTGALRAEVKGFDRLPVSAERGTSTIFPRATTRQRISEVVAALCDADPAGAVATVLGAMDLTTDESVRFQLWEAVLDHVSALRAREVARRVAAPGHGYSAKAGREVLALARALPEGLLVEALQIDEEDLRKAAVDRHGGAGDVATHRRAIDAERREARAWQALVLLSIASRASGGDDSAQSGQSSRALLVRWAEEADAELADAARAALVMLGDDESADLLARRAEARGGRHLVEAMRAQVSAKRLGSGRTIVRPLRPGEDATCSACGRRPSEVSHMVVGGAGGCEAVCNVCLAEIAMHRRELVTDDPEAVCALSGRDTFETAAMYVYRGDATGPGLTVSREVVDLGLGLLEREAVDRFLAAV